MAVRVRCLIACVLLTSLLAIWSGALFAGQHWFLFIVYVVAVVLSSGMKVVLPRSDSTMSVNFPFILLAILQLSPLQAMAVAGVSVFAQCKFRVQTQFSVIQIAFNIANSVNATAACWFAYVWLRQLHVAAAPSLALGATLYFFASTLPVAVIISWSTEREVMAVWRANFAWFLPFYIVGATLSAIAQFLSVHYGQSTALLLAPAAYTIYRSYNAQIMRLRERERHIADMESLHLRTIESLAMAIEAKDQDTHDHLLRVRVYVTAIGEILLLTPDEMMAVKTAALLHDIGKLAVPERIINKPGKLSPEEFETMKIHPVVGADILERVHFPYPVVPIVRAHHEWWNGMGYPDGLRGEAIPIGARILTVVDSFDAMASDRPYRRAMAPGEAMAIVRKLAGTQFDPRVVDVLEQHHVRLQEQARLEGEKLLRLDTEVKVSRGLAPGAGFEQDSAEAEAARQSGGQAAATGGSRAMWLPDGPDLTAALAQSMQALVVTTGSFEAALQLDETLALMALRLALLIPFDCMVFYSREGDTLLSWRVGVLATRFFSGTPVAVGEGLSGWAALHQRSIVDGNARVEPNYIHQKDSDDDLRSALSMPIRDLEERVLGVLSLYSAHANAFSRDHLRALEASETKLSLVLTSGAGEQTAEPRVPEQEHSADLFVSLRLAIEECRAAKSTLTLLVYDHDKTLEPLPREYRGGDGSLVRSGDLSMLLLPEISKAQLAQRIETLRGGRAGTHLPLLAPRAFGSAMFPADGDTAETLFACAERRMHREKREQQTLLPAGVA